jgi:endonuclease-8
MSGRWTVRPRGRVSRGLPWLVLRGSRVEGVLWNGPVLELHARALARLGPDVLSSPPDVDAMLARLRRADGTRPLGESLQDQTIVAGIGNMWAAETLWRLRLSPWLRLSDVPEAERRRALETAARLMRSAVEAGREPRAQVHARAGRPCPRCGAAIAAWGQGDANRTAYWCSACQPLTPSGPGPAGSFGTSSG